MYKLKPFIMALFLAFGTMLVTSTVHAVDSNEVMVAGPAKMNQRLLVVGTGAVIGIVVFNMLTYPMHSMPFAAGGAAAVSTDMALGSRLFAAAIGTASALGTHYVYSLFSQ
ncbi:hypothetical protein TI04_02520 [Achromatium sp. WMS2]|nr:hypothetical protein TI04_02520 [Achromatium sp. WMS2]